VRVRVFLQDELFADALSAVLEAEDFEVSSVRTLGEAVRTASTADAVIIDMRADGALGAVQELSKESPRLRVLGCIEASDPRQGAAVMKAGATGCVSTADLLDRLVHLLRGPVGSMASRAAIDRGSARRVASGIRDRYGLTARETEVLHGLARGASTETLASTLHVGAATARTHVHNVLAKLGVHTRLEAVAYAIEHQLVHLEDLVDEEEEGDATSHVRSRQM
jgi:two-component system, NarL family, nitrate/nitrite response regulator NarL